MSTFDNSSTTSLLRPRAEGANIGPWIGFKHFMYLAEEAVLQHLRRYDLGPFQLFYRYGLGVEIVEAQIGLPAKLTQDDEVRARVDVVPAPAGGLRFDVELTAVPGAARDDDVIAAKSRLRVGFIREHSVLATEPVPHELDRYVLPPSPGLSRRETPDDIRALLIPPDANAIMWTTRIPYYYCHYSTRMSYSGYVRLLEEAADRFLAERGISVRTMLDRMGWAPVVSRASVRLLDEARMEETLHVVFTVQDIVKETLYQAKMDCFVEREKELVHTGTGTIVHGYLFSSGSKIGQLVTFDPRTSAALRGVK